jgi:hypothetical protein
MIKNERGGVLFFGVLFVALGSFGYSARAQEQSSDLLSPAIVAERAEKRLYPGGRDEQELVVRSRLPQPSRSPDASPQLDDDEASSAD